MMADYTRTFEGKRLLEKHKLTDHGTWRVEGEDSNCDMGGRHVQPLLGYFTGVLQDVIDIAVDLPLFWSCGAGGTITKIEVMDANPDIVRQRKLLRLEKESILARLKVIESEL